MALKVPYTSTTDVKAAYSVAISRITAVPIVGTTFQIASLFFVANKRGFLQATEGHKTQAGAAVARFFVYT